MAGDDKWEDESLIVVELSGIIEQDWIQNIGDRCKIVGLDTEEPLLQIDRYVFSGQHKDTDGTDVIFEHSPGCDRDKGSPKLRYKCHTFKKLSMQRAFLTAKDGETGAAAAGVSADDAVAEQEPADADADVADDEPRDVSSTSHMDTDTPEQHTTEITTEETNQQKHTSDVTLESGAVPEKDVGAQPSGEGNVSMEES